MAWPLIPRRWLLRAAGAGALAAAPSVALTQEGAPAKPDARQSPWTVWFAGQRIWAYADRTSFNPGEPLHVMMAGGPGQPRRRVRLEVFRIGATDAPPVWTSPFVDVGHVGATA